MKNVWSRRWTALCSVYIWQKTAGISMEEPQGQNRFNECAKMLLELSDELERNLYIEAIVKEYGMGISMEDLRKRVGRWQ